MMKKLATLLLMFMMLASISSVTLADEAGDNPDGPEGDDDQQTGENETQDPDEMENETEDPEENETDDDMDNETEEQLEIMNNSIGAEIRLLQLEKAILKNLLKGEMTIDVLLGLGVNVSELRVILDELHLLFEEVQAADPEANDSVEVFVSLKKEAKTLTKDFREALRELLDSQTMHELREQIRNVTSDDLDNCSRMLRNRIRQFNRNQLYRLYGVIGEGNNSFVNAYFNGSMSLGQVKLHLCKMINQMNKEQKHLVFSEMKEENIKKRIQGKAVANDLKHGGHGKGGHGKP